MTNLALNENKKTKKKKKNKEKKLGDNQFYNILKLFDDVLNSSFTASETMGAYFF